MAYRSLPRPSSPRDANASIVRPYTLGKKLLASRYVAILFDSRLAFQGSKNGAEVVGLTGVEPVTSSLSGTRSNQLSYKPRGVGGGSRIRTGDILLAKQALYQLSHAPRGGTRPALSEGRRDTDREGDAGGSRRASTSGPKGSLLLRKEVIQPLVPQRLPCYDFIPITTHTLGRQTPDFGCRRLS